MSEKELPAEEQPSRVMPLPPGTPLESMKIFVVDKKDQIHLYTNISSAKIHFSEKSKRYLLIIRLTGFELNMQEVHDLNSSKFVAVSTANHGPELYFRHQLGRIMNMLHKQDINQPVAPEGKPP